MKPPLRPARTTMARWRLWLLAWMQRFEYPEWRAMGLPADRVQVVDLTVEDVEELRNEKPGFVIYEDGYQVAAIPFGEETLS